MPQFSVYPVTNAADETPKKERKKVVCSTTQMNGKGYYILNFMKKNTTINININININN